MDRPDPISRRAFLRRGAGLAAVIGAGPLVAACIEQAPVGPVERFALARQDRPVTLPTPNEPIDSGRPIEQGGTLRVLSWPLYVKPSLLRRFEDEYDVRIKWTNFNSIDDAVARIRGSDEPFDLFFPTVDVLGKLVAADLLRPLNHDYLPNRRYLWDLVADPFYDRGSRYTVPYFVWTTGIAWRNDKISEAAVRRLDNPYEIFWRHPHRGHVHLLNGSREALAMTLIKNGVTDVNTGDPRLLDEATEDLLDLNDRVETAYDHLDYRDLWGEAELHQSWSGNIGFAHYYAPKPSAAASLSYWWPASNGSGIPGVIGSDTMVVMAGGGAPVAAHAFINFLLDPGVALANVTYEGYQQPLKTLQPDVLLDQGVILPSQRDVMVREADFADGLQILELTPPVEAMWQDAYAQVALQPGRLP